MNAVLSDSSMVRLILLIGCLRTLSLSPRRPLTSNGFQKTAHLRRCSNGDADEARCDVMTSIAQQNSLLVELSNQSRPASSKVCQKKIPRAGIRLHIELL